MIKAKLLDKYAVDVIDVKHMSEMIHFRSSQLIQAINVKQLLPEERSEALQKVYDDRDKALLELDVYLPFEETTPPAVGYGNSLIPYYEVVGGVVVQKWELRMSDPVAIEQQIEALKTELAASDYKVTKCYEASLVGKELPYDVVVLHEERQGLRDRIGELGNSKTE